jgi:hypothetical protein
MDVFTNGINAIAANASRLGMYRTLLNGTHTANPNATPPTKSAAP